MGVPSQNTTIVSYVDEIVRELKNLPPNSVHATLQQLSDRLDALEASTPSETTHVPIYEYSWYADIINIDSSFVGESLAFPSFKLISTQLHTTTEQICDDIFAKNLVARNIYTVLATSGTYTRDGYTTAQLFSDVIPNTSLVHFELILNIYTFSRITLGYKFSYDGDPDNRVYSGISLPNSIKNKIVLRMQVLDLTTGNLVTT